MAVSTTSQVVAAIGPLQDAAFVLVDIGAQGPNPAITSGKALASVVLTTAGVPFSNGPSTSQFPASLGPKAGTGSLSVVNSFLTSVAGGTASASTSVSQITVGSTVQVMEFFNRSGGLIWGSWTSTAPSSTNNSIPIPAMSTSNVAGFYSPPPGASGTFSVIASSAGCGYTCDLWS